MLNFTVIREREIKIRNKNYKMIPPLTHQSDKMKKIENAKNQERCGVNETLRHCWWRYTPVQPHSEPFGSDSRLNTSYSPSIYLTKSVYLFTERPIRECS